MMKPIQIVNDRARLTCHDDVVAKEILPWATITIMDNGNGVKIRAMAAGSAVSQGRPVRLWIIIWVVPDQADRILAVSLTHCDVSKDEELAAVHELGEAFVRALLDGLFDGPSDESKLQ